MTCNGDCNQGRECNCECKKETKMTKHKWYKEIQAWSEGAEIEALKAGIWFTTDYPAWDGGEYQFRIKPQPKQKKYLYVWQELNYGKAYITANSNHSCAPAGHEYMGKIEVQDD